MDDLNYLLENVPLLITLVSLSVVGVTLMVFAIVHLLKKPRVGNNWIPWLLLIILVDLLGPIIYFAVGSNKLDEDYAAHEQAQADAE